VALAAEDLETLHIKARDLQLQGREILVVRVMLFLAEVVEREQQGQRVEAAVLVARG
jgi:hypothetical protein